MGLRDEGHGDVPFVADLDQAHELVAPRGHERRMMAREPGSEGERLGVASEQARDSSPRRRSLRTIASLAKSMPVTSTASGPAASTRPRGPNTVPVL